ncbi:MAG TPA: class II glutamine amidotransferase [Myxococcales bacterium]|nr:class II glutamine amidotransferase [Deltaproteobacteria bacterium]HAA58237.1 class II glutamine amidotransferase [Myxococcales bacterium]
MCRLFGFRSVIPSQVHTSLMSADNALMVQSERHPDGWGVAYYVAGAPHLIKSASTAIQDSLFQHVSGVVSSETVIAHLRKATQGELSIINTHPFQYGSWVFAHNGNLRNFSEHRDELRAKIAPKLKRFILGGTDSEVLFYLILTHLERRVELHRAGVSIEDAVAAIQETVEEVCEIVGDYSHDDSCGPYETYLSFILSNGQMMLAHQGGQQLFYSTYKHKCSVSHMCPSYGKECESPTEKGFINHMIFSSEPLQGENVWVRMVPGQIIGVDWRMQVGRFGTEVPMGENIVSFADAQSEIR